MCKWCAKSNEGTYTFTQAPLGVDDVPCGLPYELDIAGKLFQTMNSTHNGYVFSRSRCCLDDMPRGLTH